MTDTKNNPPPAPQSAETASGSTKRQTLTLKHKRHRDGAGQGTRVGKATAAPNPAEPATPAVKSRPKAKPKSKAEVEPSPYRAYDPLAVFEDAQRRFPGVFDLNAPPGPLAVGARAHYFPDLVELGWSKKSVRRFVEWYVQRIDYHRVAMTADHRLTPDGGQGEAMLASQRDYHTTQYRAAQEAPDARSNDTQQARQ